jgi:acetyl esterase/lipase
VQRLRSVLLVVIVVGPAFAQQAGEWTTSGGTRYWIAPDITYSVANNYQNKLDVIHPHDAKAPVPAVIYMHGGGSESGGTR